MNHRIKASTFFEDPQALQHDIIASHNQPEELERRIEIQKGRHQIFDNTDFEKHLLQKLENQTKKPRFNNKWSRFKNQKFEDEFKLAQVQHTITKNHQEKLLEDLKKKREGQKKEETLEPQVTFPNTDIPSVNASETTSKIYPNRTTVGNLPSLNQNRRNL